MHIACWLSKATNTPSEYVIHTAFPLQEWLQEFAPLVRYTYTRVVNSIAVVLPIVGHDWSVS